MGDLPLLGTNAQIIRIVEALFGVQPGNTYYTNFQDFVAESSVDALSNALVGALAPADAASLAATVAANYQVDPALETDTGENVIALLETYITAQLNTVPEAEWGAKILEITNQYTNLWTDPLLGASVTKFNDMVVKSLVYSANPANPDVNDPDVGPVMGDPILLTTAQDNLTGTDANDIFNAFIFNNSNTLQSGDQIDGGAGMDTLFADIGDSQNFAITPDTNSVEKLQVRAQAVSTDSNENNMSNGVQIDAERMKGTDWYETNNSRSDVTIEDVRILRTDAYGDSSNQITQDVTVAMVSTDPGNVDLGVYFDQHSLVNEGDSLSNSITLTIGNQVEEVDFDAAAPLKDVPYTNVGFLVNGEQVVLALDLTGVETYDQLWDVLKASFDAAKADGDFSSLLANVAIDRSIGTDTFFSRDGVLRNADEYLLTIEQGDITPSDIGWTAEGGLPSNNAFSANVTQGDVTVTSNLITSEIILDDVGRGSMGGDLIVGGMSIGTGDIQGEGTSNSRGVEQFNIKVERSSQLQEIQSTNNTLEEVYIVNGDTKGDLVVKGDTSLGLAVDQNDLPGSDANTSGFLDVRVVDASAMEGKVDLNAELSSNVVSKYLDLKDTATNAATDNRGFMYDLGTNDDKLMLNISNANLAAAGTTTREDFYLNVNGNGGNDSITTTIETGDVPDTTNWYVNSKINANLTVNGGAGDDTINTRGAGDFKINGDSGNDTVYANNDGIGVAANAINEIQTLTFSGTTAAGGSIVVNGATVALGANLTAIQVAAAVTAAVAADPVASADFDPLFGGSITDNLDGSVSFTFDDNAAAMLADRAPIVVTEKIGTLSTPTVANGVAGTDAVVAVAEVTNVTFAAAAEAIGNTIIFDGTTVTLADTDGSGLVEQDEVTAQFSVASFANFTVTGVDLNAGTVQLTANTAGADLSVATGGSIAGVDMVAADFAGTAAVPATVGFAGVGLVAAGGQGVDAVAAAAAGDDVLTFQAANQTGTITLSVDADGLLATPNQVIDVAVTQGDSAITVATKATAALNAALTDWTATDNGDGTVNLAPAAILGAVVATTVTDNAMLASTSNVETLKGVEATTSDAATWVLNATDVNIDNLESNAAVANGILYNSTVTVTYSGARHADSGVINDAANDFSNGFESKVTIGTTGNLGSQLQVNQAIKEAINNDAVLSKLLVATDGPSNTLVITSLVDGRFEANDLEIKIAAPSSLSATELTSLNATHKAQINNSALTDLDQSQMIAVIQAQIDAIDAGGAYTTETFAQRLGTDMAGNTSLSDSDNTINLGTGDDVAVLGTDDTSNDTLVFEGTFGNDSIFNFDNTTGAAADRLDFVSYLTNELSTSGSTVSAARIATTGENIGVAASVLTANEVATVNDFTGGATETWANLTAADLLEAIKGTNTAGAKDYGNIVEGSFDVAKITNLVGNVQNGIIMVENDLNDGEYKVFSTFADNATEEFTAVTLVGTIDFGDTISAAVAGALV
jgi:hypothetical protein